jgi:hypothetical protein
MRTTTYSAIERGVSSIAGIDPDNVLAHEKSILAEYINDAVNYCWDYYPWGEFTITEKRSFRVPYDSSLVYDVGDEVFYENKFYRKHSQGTFNLPTSPADWHEIGDKYTDTPWSESGLYGIGAKVNHEGKHFVCIQESALGKTNYLTDGIDTTNSQYFYEVNPFFERFIPYEQTGYNTIGNCLGCYTDDPRYSNTQHLNFREGREGIYIDGKDRINEFWMVYKIEAPTFTPNSTESTIPRFLAQAIKAHAYQSWLVGEGQHEKAQLQELKILDLLVREVDKIDQYANKNKPFSIAPNSSELINSRQSQVVDGTPHLIGQLAQRESELTFKLGTIVKGRNPFQKRTANLNLSTNVDGIVSQDILDPRRKYGTTTCHANLGVPAITGNAIKSTSVNSLGLSLGVVAEGRDYGQASGVDPIVMTLVVDPPYGNRVFSNEADLSLQLNISNISLTNSVVRGNASSNIALGVDNVIGANCVVRENATSSVSINVPAITPHIIKGNAINVSMGLSLRLDTRMPIIRNIFESSSGNGNRHSIAPTIDPTGSLFAINGSTKRGLSLSDVNTHLEPNSTYVLTFKMLSQTAINNIITNTTQATLVSTNAYYEIGLLDELNPSVGVSATIDNQPPAVTGRMAYNGNTFNYYNPNFPAQGGYTSFRLSKKVVGGQLYDIPLPLGANSAVNEFGSKWRYFPTFDTLVSKTISVGNLSSATSRAILCMEVNYFERSIQGVQSRGEHTFDSRSFSLTKV